MLGVVLGECRTSPESEGKPLPAALLALVADYGTTISLPLELKRVQLVAAHVRGVLEEAKKRGVELDRVHFEALRQELERHLQWDASDEMFMHLSAEDAKHYNDESVLTEHGRGQFPRAHAELVLAGNCLAADCNTASVFHSMRAAERALHAHAEMLGVKFPFSIDLADWKNVIEGIEAKVVNLKVLPKSDTKSDETTFHSKAANQYWYLKDAWRNHVAHAREDYDQHQARTILTHVADLIEHLSQRVKESDEELTVSEI